MYISFPGCFIIFHAVPFLPIPATDNERCHYVVTKDWALTMNILTMIISFQIIVVHLHASGCILANERNQSARCHKK